MAQQGSSFSLPYVYGRAQCLRPVWEVLGLPGGGGGVEQLCMCRIDPSKCFWSLRLPEAFLGAFRISDGEGGVLSFSCLPFGWKYCLILCQKVLERLVEEIGLVGVFVLIYIDDVLIVGQSKARVREQVLRAVKALCTAGGVISPKSTLEPVTRLMWLGKDVDLGGGSFRTAGNAWEAVWHIGCDCPLVYVVCGACNSFWDVHSGSAGLLLGIVPMCYGDSAVYPPQVAVLYVCGVCLGVAGLVGGILAAGRA